MKVLLLTYGTRGDVQPFAALARALNAAGHEAILGAPAGSADLVEPYGVRFAPLHDMWSKLINDPAVRAIFETDFRGLGGKKVAIQVRRKFRPTMTRVLGEMAAAAEHDTELVVHHPTVPGHEIAERLGVPAVPACLEPMWVPTMSFPNAMVPFRLPRTLNRASYLVTRRSARRSIGSTAKWRKQTLGLSRRRGHHNPLQRPDGTPATVLQAFSQHLLPQPLDYPDWVHTTGFWFLPAPPDWTPPQQLSDFLAAGDPPVYIGFGSAVGTDPRRTGRLVIDAIRLAGVRAVVVTGWGGIQANEFEEDVFFLDQAPFDWLFPRMAAIIHHGGSGTTGAALASGRPQVICPFIVYQAFYAWRVPANGVAPPHLPQSGLTPERLADAIRLAVTSRAMSTRARELGQQIRTEEGVTTAVKILESLT